MNEQLRYPPQPGPSLLRAPGTTQVADGLPRRAWTGDELQRMMEAAIIDADEPFELIGGEFVAKVNTGIPHEALKIELNRFWGKICPDHISFAPGSALRLGTYDEPEPDFFVFPRAIAPAVVRGDSVLLVVEIADSSLPRDRTLKMLRFAIHGVREYWVVNARTRVTTVFQGPQQAGFARCFEVAGTERLEPLLAPELALRFADLDELTKPIAIHTLRSGDRHEHGF